MSRFIQLLESRTFLSASPVTKATLLADQANIAAVVASADAALKALVADLKADTADIATDLKTLPKSNAPLLKTLKADEAKGEATVKTDLNLLVKPGTALAKKSTSTGETLLTKATVKTLAVAAVEITALGTAPTTLLANLTTALEFNPVVTDLDALVAANPGNTALANDANATANGNAFTQTMLINTAATQFATDIATLASDLSSVATAVGTFPNMVGSFTGTLFVTTGANAGGTDSLTVVITTEDASGNLTGTLIGNEFTLHSLAATVTLNGKFAGKATSTVNQTTVTLLGQFSNGTLTGTLKAAKKSGTFSLVETP